MFFTNKFSAVRVKTCHVRFRDAPLDIWGGGGARVCVACKLFFYLREKKIFFFGEQRPTIFFLCFVEEFFFYYVGYRLVFFLVNIFFIPISTTNFFFLPTFSTNFFFLTLVATNYFFLFFYPPPRDIKWCVLYNRPYCYTSRPLIHARPFSYNCKGR